MATDTTSHTHARTHTCGGAACHISLSQHELEELSSPVASNATAMIGAASSAAACIAPGRHMRQVPQLQLPLMQFASSAASPHTMCTYSRHRECKSPCNDVWNGIPDVGRQGAQVPGQASEP